MLTHVSTPNITHIGVKKTTQHGDLLNIWPLYGTKHTHRRCLAECPHQRKEHLSAKVNISKTRALLE